MDNNIFANIDETDLNKLIANDVQAIDAILSALTPDNACMNAQGEFDYDAYKQDRYEKLTLPQGVRPEPLETIVYLTTNYDPEVYVPEDTNYTLTAKDATGKVLVEHHEGTDGFMKIYQDSSFNGAHFHLSEIIKRYLITGNGLQHFPKPRENTLWLNSEFHGHANFKPYYDYEVFLQVTKQYLNDVTDFYNAYIWVKSHPMAWLHNDEGYYERMRKASIWHEVGLSDGHKPYHMFEFGSAVEPARKTTYHDFDLDVYSSTYEEGIVKLALQVLLKFNFDGSERKAKVEGYGNPEGRTLIASMQESLTKFEKDSQD